MKHCTTQLILAAIAATGLSAQPSKPAGNRPPPPPPPLLLPALDGDKNGELSADEIRNSTAALLELDKNEDGRLTPKEILPPPPKGKKPGPPPPAGPPVLVKALDLDQDRSLSADEIEDAPVSLAALDKDGDGALSRAELKPGKPPIKPET